MNDWAIRGAIGLLGLALALRWNLSSPGPQSGVIPGRACGLAMAAPILTVLVWFITAPDPRFAWGAILLAGAIPAAFALTWLGDAVRLGEPKAWQGNRVAATALAGFLVLAVLPVALGGLAQVRGFVAEGWQVREIGVGPLTVTAAVNPVPVSEVAEFTLNSGQKVTEPVGTDQCWMSFPLCRPYPDPTIYFPGDSIADGVRDSG